MKKRARTAEEKAAASKATREHNAIVRAAAKAMRCPYSNVHSCWQEIKDLSIGLVMKDTTALAMARAIVHERYPPVTREEALGMMQWAIRKVNDAELCRDVFETAIRMLEDEDEVG